MGLSLVTGPAQEPVSLAEAKAHCRIDVPDDDALLTGYILAARGYLEEISGRAFVASTWDYSIDDDWPWVFDLETRCHQQVIEIPKAPLSSVTSINYVDSAGVSQLLASNQYVVDGTGAIGRITPAYDVTWPSVRRQKAAITVRFVAGHAIEVVPDPIRQAMLLLIGHFYAHRETVVIGQTPSEVPLAVSSLIAPYRVHF